MLHRRIFGHAPMEPRVGYSPAVVAGRHGEAVGEIRPATAGLVVHALLDPSWLVEVDADAILPEPNGRPAPLEQR